MSFHHLQFLKPFSVSSFKFASSGAVSSVGYVKTSPSFLSHMLFLKDLGLPIVCLLEVHYPERRPVLEDAVVGGGSEGEASVNVENVT